jgi:hypothetical protein
MQSALRNKILLFAAVLAQSVACGSSEEAPTDAGSDAQVTDAVARPRFQDCRGRAFTPRPTQEWQHTIATPIIVASGAPGHSAQDPIDPGSNVIVHGKFTYGILGVDLNDELIHVSVDDCTGWKDLGQVATNSAGQISMEVPSTTFPGPGVYEVRLQVLGDQSNTAAYVWVLPAGTRLALTDIDGTMTESDFQLFQQILDGSHVPVAYPGAQELTVAHTVRGHVVVYLTGRPYYFSPITRAWLSTLEFARGPLHVTDTNGEALPLDSGVGDFKKVYITSLLDAGYVIDVAYGNASTDIYAYLGAGIPPEQVWIIGDNGGDQGTHAVVGDWTGRVSEVEAMPAVSQPFDW